MDGSTLFDLSGPSNALSAEVTASLPLVNKVRTAPPAAPARRVPHTVSVLSEAEYSMLMETAPAAATSGPLAAVCIAEDESSTTIGQTFDDDGELTPEDAVGVAELDEDIVGEDSIDEDIAMTVVEAAEAAPAPSSAVMAGGDMGAELDRAKVVELILGINKTVAVEYLEQFKDRSLRNYLAHLETTAQPRGRGSRWERRGDSPALVVHESAL